MFNPIRLIILTNLLVLCVAGCAGSRTHKVASTETTLLEKTIESNAIEVKTKFAPQSDALLLTAFQNDSFQDENASKNEIIPVPSTSETLNEFSQLNHLEQLAFDNNPRLAQLYKEYQAAACKSQYTDKLPDPKLGANVFGNPVETASGSQRANMSLSQSIPWLGRLDAQHQKSIFDAYVLRAEYEAERLRVLSAVRTGWYKLYVVEKQIETTNANKIILQSLIDVANARIATGKAAPGDVLLGTLELSQLEERLLLFKKQRQAIEAGINRLVGQSASTPIESPTKLGSEATNLNSNEIYQMAMANQPELKAARLRIQAAQWGIEVAEMKRRPDITLSANYFFTDNNRPASSIVNVGEDPWSIGAQISIPLWRDKYDAMKNEAGWKHAAARNSIKELSDRYDALIVEVLAESKRASETASLYQSTILPQARQTLSADQSAYSNGVVEFDRVIRDYRSLLTLELGYHNAIGDLAIAQARLEQVAGQELPAIPILVPAP